MNGTDGKNGTDGALFIFGVPDKLRPLPEGWRYEAAADEFLRAFSPGGREWYVTSKGVTRTDDTTGEIEMILWQS